MPDSSLCTASVEQIFPRDSVQRNCFELALYIMTASPIASVRVLSATQMSSRYVRCAPNAVGARSRDCWHGHAARRSALPRERFSPVALFGYGAMSDLSLKCASKRTSVNEAFDASKIGHRVSGQERSSIAHISHSENKRRSNCTLSSAHPKIRCAKNRLQCNPR